MATPSKLSTSSLRRRTLIWQGFVNNQQLRGVTATDTPLSQRGVHRLYSAITSRCGLSAARTAKLAASDSVKECVVADGQLDAAGSYDAIAGVLELSRALAEDSWLSSTGYSRRPFAEVTLFGAVSQGVPARRQRNELVERLLHQWYSAAR